MVAPRFYVLLTSLTFVFLYTALKRKSFAKGKIVGIKPGSVYDVETVKPDAAFTITLFGENIWPQGFESVWLTDADHCEDSFLLKKAVYYLTVVEQLSYENMLVLEQKNGVPENSDNFYRLCTNPSVPERPGVRTNLLAAMYAYSLPAPLYTIISLIVLTIFLSAIFSGLGLSFTSVAINELLVIIRMGDPYRSRMARNILPIRRYLNWLICTFSMANAISNCALSLLFENLLQNVTDGQVSFITMTLVPCMVTVIFGELLPLAICNRRGLYIASKTRYITWGTMIILSPVAWPFSKILDEAIGIHGFEVYDRSKIEFLILEAARKSSEVFSEILKNTINLPRIKVGNVMTKIGEAFLLSTTDTLDEKVILSIVEKGYSRIPVYEGSQKSKVIAVLNVKDLIATDFSKGAIVIDILKKLNYLKQVRFVCEEMQVRPLINEMKGQNFAFEPKGYISHLAMVVKYDSRSYSLVGLITLDDIIEEIFGEMKDEVFQWTNRRIGMHRDQATFDWLRSTPDPVAPLTQIYCIQETMEKYFGFEELSFNIHTMRRLFNLCHIHSSTDTKKRSCIYKRGCPSRAVTVMLKGRAYYLDKEGLHVPATPFECGAALIEKIYLNCLDFGTSVDLSNLCFIPKKSVYVEPPFHYIKITVRAILESLKIKELNEYRREVIEAKFTKVDDQMCDTQFSNTASDPLSNIPGSLKSISGPSLTILTGTPSQEPSSVKSLTPKSTSEDYK